MLIREGALLVKNSAAARPPSMNNGTILANEEVRDRQLFLVDIICAKQINFVKKNDDVELNKGISRMLIREGALLINKTKKQDIYGRSLAVKALA